jgi:LemA protein
MINKKGSALIAVLITLAALAIIILTAVSFIAGNYNTLVDKDTSVENQWGKVQSAYERRLDLLPNLAATVKGSAAF